MFRPSTIRLLSLTFQTFSITLATISTVHSLFFNYWYHNDISMSFLTLCTGSWRRAECRPERSLCWWAVVEVCPHCRSQGVLVHIEPSPHWSLQFLLHSTEETRTRTEKQLQWQRKLYRMRLLIFFIFLYSTEIPQKRPKLTKFSYISQHSPTPPASLWLLDLNMSIFTSVRSKY